MDGRLQDPSFRWNGMRVLTSELLEQDGEPYTVRRTWRARLFSRPWRPFVATRTIVPRVPYQGALRLDASTLVMHPVAVELLRSLSAKAAEAGR